MGDVAVCTANIGGYDELRPQILQDIDVDWVCFADEDATVPDPWWHETTEPSDSHPNLVAKSFKCSPPLPHRFVIWIDANVSITSPSFAREALDSIQDGLALFHHPRRDCIYAEAEASLGAESQNGRYAHLPIREQVEWYRSAGHPEHAGLYACGTIAWDRENKLAWQLGEEWLKECRRWGYQDQISFPVICRRLGVRPGTFPFSQLEYRRPLGNRWFLLHPHLSR